MLKISWRQKPPHLGEGAVIPPYSPEFISHAVWLYFCFSLSFRDVEALLTQRGIVVTYETEERHTTLILFLLITCNTT